MNKLAIAGHTGQR